MSNIILDSNLDAYSCPVYMTDLERDANTLDCGHTYSSAFVKDIYERSIQNCPMCNEKITHISSKNYLFERALNEIRTLREEKANLQERVAQYETVLQKTNLVINKFIERIDFLEKEVVEIKKQNVQMSIERNLDKKKYEEISKQNTRERIIYRDTSPSKSTSKLDKDGCCVKQLLRSIVNAIPC